MRLTLLLITAAVVAAAVSPVQANRNCDDYVTPLLCEDFDMYCTNVDPGIGQCPRDDSADAWPNPLRNRWPNTSMNYHLSPDEVCGSQWSIEDNGSLLTSEPFGGREVNGGDEGGTLGQQTADLVDGLWPGMGIKTRFGAQYDQVLGTDETPLYLSFTMSGGLKTASFLAGSNGYMELALEENPNPLPGQTPDYDPEVTPTDYVLVGIDEFPSDPLNDCISCYQMCDGPDYSVHVPWPTICQSYDARTESPACPPVPETKIHKTLAIGALALLDNNPCHCNEANQKPLNYHLAFFDGWKWRSFKSNSYGGGTGSGDFSLGDKYDLVELWVKTTTVDVDHTSRRWVNGAWSVEYSYARGVPRKYLGGFNKLRAGTSSACELKNDVYQCVQWAGTKCHKQGASRCDPGGGYQGDNSRYVSFDDVLLTDGEPSGGVGACCLQDGTCQDNKTRAECDDLQGWFRGFQSVCGDGSICNGACCKGLASCEDGKKKNECPFDFQGPGTYCADGCPCPDPFADTDLDGDVDQVDFAVFQGCFGGPGETVSESCKCFDRHPVVNPAAGSDNDVDLDDLMKFELCASGPGIPLNPNCDL